VSKSNDGKAQINALDLAICTAMAAVGIVAMRWLLKPGNAQQVHMRIALVTKRVSQSQADYWQVKASRAATRYNALRSVDV
jgi:ActR/RegA family two-component response regulator